VPALAALLLDERLSDMARYALQRIEDPSALAAMRASLPKAKGNQKIGLINSLGERGDTQALDAIVAALEDPNQAVAIAAARALGKIGGAKAAEALGKLLPKAQGELAAVVTDAYLACADGLLAAGQRAEALAIYQRLYKPDRPKHTRLAALRGLVAAEGAGAMPLVTEILTGTDPLMQASVLRFLREVAGPATTAPLAGLLPKLPPAAQVLVLKDLALRGDRSALPAVQRALESPRDEVRRAALEALAVLGDASCLPTLLRLAAGGPLADAARQALDSLPTKDVNPALVRVLKTGEPSARKEAARSLGARGAKSAVPALLEAARQPDPGVRQAAIKALEALAGPEVVPQLVELVVRPRDAADRPAAQRTLAAVCARAPKKEACASAVAKAVASASAEGRIALLGVLPHCPTAGALDAVRRCLKDGDPKVQDAAVRTLAQWPDPAAASDLLALATSTSNTAHHALALRRYIRLAGSPTLKAAQRLEMYRKAMQAARRDDERRQVLGGLGGVKAVEALNLVMPALDNPALQREACAAAVNIAKNLGGRAKETIRKAMKKVLEVSKDNRLRSQAQGLLKKAGG